MATIGLLSTFRVSIHSKIHTAATAIVIRVNRSPALVPKALWPPMPPNAPVIHHAIDVADGFREARTVARPGDRVLVFGSFLTVGPALEFLGL